MRYLRRAGDAMGSRQLFLRARKWCLAPQHKRVPWQVYAAAALLEWQVGHDSTVASKIFEKWVRKQKSVGKAGGRGGSGECREGLAPTRPNESRSLKDYARQGGLEGAGGGGGRGALCRQGAQAARAKQGKRVGMLAWCRESGEKGMVLGIGGTKHGVGNRERKVGCRESGEKSMASEVQGGNSKHVP
eukprot:332384-Chlamydomonas_euryale.AAC.4